MVLLALQCESASIESCVKEMNQKSVEALKNVPGTIRSSRISLSFGAFMNLTIVMDITPFPASKKLVLVDYAVGKGKDGAISRVVEKINSKTPQNGELVDFEVKTYTTPVTRRTYAVGVIVCNVPMEQKSLKELTLQERRQFLAGVLRAFDYNPKVLNISELARVFGVSRDSIYYDIKQIMKEVRG